MPGDPKECRGPRSGLEHAAAASSPLVKDNFLSLAQTWSRLRELEASKRFLDALGEEFVANKMIHDQRFN
jgi:hypothetical protein